MITKLIKTKLNQTKIISISAFIIMMFALTLVASAKDDQFQPAPKDQLIEFYKGQFKNFYDSIPEDILQKYATTIAEVDRMVSDNRLTGGITSKTRNFDLDYYSQIIKVGIIPYIGQNDPLNKELQGLVNDIDQYTLDRKKLEEYNKALYGNEMPVPTTFGNSTEEDKVRISLNGSGYNVSKAIEYAYKWTQNGKQLRNSNYNYYTGLNDCTNFVSQVLHDLAAGKISYVHNDNWGWDYDDPDNWYYANGFMDPPAYTWGGAHNLYGHLKKWSSNVKRVYSWSDVKIGDIIQWDLKPNDGVFYIEHSTVVTKIENGKIYLTYHTIDKKDEPITTFTNAKYNGYAWAINHK